MRSDQRFSTKITACRHDARFMQMSHGSCKDVHGFCLEQAMTTLAFAACGASLLVAPVDLILSPTDASLILALFAKCAFILVGLVVINYGRLAYPVFAFCSCMSVLFFCLRLYSGSALCSAEVAALSVDAAIKLAFVAEFVKASIGHPEQSACAQRKPHHERPHHS